MPKSLDLGRLKQFEPASDRKTEQLEPRSKDGGSVPERWPSREPSLDGQISIKGPMRTINRFKAMCKDDRRTYADMLEILMDDFEHKS